MSGDAAPLPPPVPPPPSAPAVRSLRPPPPGPGVWLAFLFGPILLLATGSAVLQLASGSSWDGLPFVVVLGAMAGLVVGACGVGGLALATRFYAGLAGRIVGGLLLGVALLVGLAAVAFAGSMCVAGSTNLYR